MPAHFLNIASELRNGIYECLLLHGEVIDPWSDHNRYLNVGLLSTNKLVHREASSLFYGGNYFDLSRQFPESIASFFGQVGNSNAGSIRHVSIDFPGFNSLEVDHISIDDDSVEIMGIIRDNCFSISTLTMSVHSTYAAEHRLDALDHARITKQALELVDTTIRATFPLNEIIVELYEDSPNDQARREMENLGWTTRIVQDMAQEGLDGSLSDYDNCSVESDDSYSEDDYDIDNDSDFWRRAAD